MNVKPAQSPLAPKTTPTLPRVAGVKLGAARSGVRYKDRDDIMLAVGPARIKSGREDGSAAAAGAIMTTDTFPKLATRQAKIGERTVTINGFLKGSGMIAPDMATMLGFVFTDAKVPSGVLQKLVADAADKSLNCVTVDGDTSTSDTLLMVATGAARHAPIEAADDP